MGYRYEVFVSGKWYDNSVVFATEAEARHAADIKMWNWTACDDTRVVEVDKPANYRCDEDGTMTHIAGAA